MEDYQASGDHAPRLLMCGHSFCFNCLRDMPAGADGLSCPTCRKVTRLPGGGVEALSPNFALIELLNMLKPQQAQRKASEAKRPAPSGDSGGLPDEEVKVKETPKKAREKVKEDLQPIPQYEALPYEPVVQPQQPQPSPQHAQQEEKGGEPEVGEMEPEPEPKRLFRFGACGDCDCRCKCPRPTGKQVGVGVVLLALVGGATAGFAVAGQSLFRILLDQI